MLKVLSPEEMKIAMEQSIPSLLSAKKLKEYCITKEQEQNLRTLVVGLERLLPTHADIFSINRYAYDFEEAQKSTIKHPCGTSACAVGYGPSCGIPFIKDELWIEYCDRVFGAVTDDTVNYSIQDFMFSSNWHRANHKCQMREAIARIKLVLAGKFPKKFVFTESYVKEK